MYVIPSALVLICIINVLKLYHTYICLRMCVFICTLYVHTDSSNFNVQETLRYKGKSKGLYL